MGFEDIDNEGSFVKFNKGDNALVKPHRIEPDHNEEYDEYQLSLVFDAVNESDHSEEGRLPAWVSSKITISDSDEHTSALGQMLQSAGVLRNVLKDLGADSGKVEAVISGETRFVAGSDDENEELGKAVAQNLQGKTLRVGTTHNKSGDYSKVDEFYRLADEDPFDDTSDSSGDDSGSDSDSDSSDDTDQEDEDGEDEEDDVLFGEDDEDLDEDEG